MGKITKTTCLVTGGAGFIGSHVVAQLVRLDNRVTVMDMYRDPRSLFNAVDGKVTFHKIDIRDRKKISTLIGKIRPQHIFHLAAQAIVDVAYENPVDTLETNIMGTAHILEAARKTSSIQSIIVASSDKAYGKKEKKYLETDPLRGDHPYEVSKSATDLISYSYYKTYGLPVVVTRFGNVYGEGDMNFSRIIPGIMKAIIKNETLMLRSDGTYMRDYVYVKDVARGYILLADAIKKTRGEAFNFGSHETLSVIALIERVQKIVGVKIKYKILNSAKNEIPAQSLDFTKITKLVSWKPTWSLETSIPNIFSYYKNIL